MQPPRAALFASAVLLFGLGALTGAFAGARFALGERASEVPAVAPERRDASSVELAPTLAALREAIAGLREALERIDARAEGSPRIVAADPAERDELANALRELSRSVEDMRKGRPGTTASAARVVDPAERERAFGLDVFREAARSRDSDELEALEQGALLRHVAWSYDDVLAAYGKPDRVVPFPERMLWYYEFGSAPGDRDRIRFDFNDGIVWYVDYEE